MKTYNLTHFDYYRIDTQLEAPYAKLMQVWSHERDDGNEGAPFYVGPKQIMAFLTDMEKLETDQEIIAQIKADYPELLKKYEEEHGAAKTVASSSDPAAVYQAEIESERKKHLDAIERDPYDFVSRVKLAGVYFRSSDIGNALEQYSFIVDNEDMAKSGLDRLYLSYAQAGVEQCLACRAARPKIEYPTAPTFTPESAHILEQFLEQTTNRLAGPTPTEAAGKFVFHSAKTETEKDTTAMPAPGTK